jgi:short-subunit dehydrogenase
MVQKRIIIIGATSGIGKEIACIYAEKGDKVAITGRRAVLLKELQEKHPHQIIFSCFDVMDLHNTENIQILIEQLGGLDLLIYCAGYGEPSDKLDPQIEEMTIRTNVMGFVQISGEAFRYFMQQGYGQIALVSSIAAIRGNSLAPAYSASKAFMGNYAEGLNIKAWKSGKDIIISDIRPGFMNTKMAKGHRRFWVAPVNKAARQIVASIEKRKRIAYITRRWRLIALLMPLLPYKIYRRLV